MGTRAATLEILGKVGGTLMQIIEFEKIFDEGHVRPVKAVQTEVVPFVFIVVSRLCQLNRHSLYLSFRYVVYCFLARLHRSGL